MAVLNGGSGRVKKAVFWTCICPEDGPGLDATRFQLLSSSGKRTHATAFRYNKAVHEYACDVAGPLHSRRRPLLRLSDGCCHIPMEWHSLIQSGIRTELSEYGRSEGKILPKTLPRRPCRSHSCDFRRHECPHLVARLEWLWLARSGLSSAKTGTGCWRIRR